MQIFPSAEALTEYTIQNAAYFPKGHDAAGQLLRRVLRRHPTPESYNVKEAPSTENNSRKATTRVERNSNKSALAQQIIEDIELSGDRNSAH